MQNSGYKWFPVCTNPRAEKKASELLRAKGIEVYLPLQKKLKQWSDRKKLVEEPLFKSYIFVNITEKDRLEVLKTSGISRFIYFSGKAATVRNDQIDALRLLLSSEFEFEVVQRTFQKGTIVRINEGPLLGLKGELINVLSQKKLLVRIGEINQSILVQVPALIIEPIEDTKEFAL